MARTGKGGFRPTKRKAAPGAWIRLKVKGGGSIRVGPQQTPRAPIVGTEADDAGLIRYLNPGRRK